MQHYKSPSTLTTDYRLLDPGSVLPFSSGPESMAVTGSLCIDGGAGASTATSTVFTMSRNVHPRIFSALKLSVSICAMMQRTTSPEVKIPPQSSDDVQSERCDVLDTGIGGRLETVSRFRLSTLSPNDICMPDLRQSYTVVFDEDLTLCKCAAG